MYTFFFLFSSLSVHWEDCAKYYLQVYWLHSCSLKTGFQGKRRSSQFCKAFRYTYTCGSSRSKGGLLLVALFFVFISSPAKGLLNVLKTYLSPRKQWNHKTVMLLTSYLRGLKTFKPRLIEWVCLFLHHMIIICQSCTTGKAISSLLCELILSVQLC